MLKYKDDFSEAGYSFLAKHKTAPRFSKVFDDTVPDRQAFLWD